MTKKVRQPYTVPPLASDKRDAAIPAKTRKRETRLVSALHALSSYDPKRTVQVSHEPQNEGDRDWVLRHAGGSASGTRQTTASYDPKPPIHVHDFGDVYAQPRTVDFDFGATPPHARFKQEDHRSEIRIYGRHVSRTDGLVLGYVTRDQKGWYFRYGSTWPEHYPSREDAVRAEADTMPSERTFKSVIVNMDPERP
jgi:hypothetical protein